MFSLYCNEFLFPFFQKATQALFTMYHPWKKPRKGHSTTVALCRPLLLKPGELLDLIKQHTISVSSMKKTGNPVKLLNVSEENGQYLVNQMTTLPQMSNSDLTFTSTLPSSSSDCGFHKHCIKPATNPDKEPECQCNRSFNSWSKITKTSHKKKWPKRKG